MLRVMQQQQEDTHESNRDRHQKAPAEALLTKDEDLKGDSDERQRGLENRGEAGGHILLCPENRAIRNHEHERADGEETAPLCAHRTRTATEAHDGVKQST